MEEPQTHRRAKPRRRTSTGGTQVGRRQRSVAPPLALDIAFSIPTPVRERHAREWIVRVSTRALLMHVLYARGVCPAPAFEVLRVYRDSTEKPSPTDRKFVKFGTSLQCLLDEWTTLSGSINIQRALVTLGPSWSRPKECYMLDFSLLENDDSGDKPEPSLEQEHALSRRLVCALLNQMSNEERLYHPDKAAAAYQVHVSVWMTHQESQSLFDKSRRDSKSPLLQSLIMRHDYSVTRMASKRNQPHIVTTKVSSCSPNLDAEWTEHDGIWVSLPTSVKGFRL